MSIKPVAWMGESPGGSLLISKHQADSYEWLDRKWKVTPLYSAPAPELAEALQLAIKELKRLRNCDDDEFSTFNWHDTLQAIEGGSKLLARITPK